MTPPDVARATGISLATVYRNLHNSTLHGEWTGSRWNISKDECLSWVAWMRGNRACCTYPQDFVARFIEHFNLD